MSSQPRPMLLYAYPAFFPSPRRVLLYLAEKKVPPKYLTLIPEPEDEKSKRFPPKPEGFVPVLAIPNSKRSEADPANPTSYTWLYESAAIIEYLEDICDADSSITSTPSMRGGSDLAKRAMIRGVIELTSEMFVACNYAAMFGNTLYAQLFKTSTISPQTAKEIVPMMRKRTLEYIERLLPSASDLEGLEAGKQNVVTTADCVLFTALWFEKVLYGVDLAEGYGNLRKFVDAFEKTDCAMSFPALPEGVPAFKDAWTEGVWER